MNRTPLARAVNNSFRQVDDDGVLLVAELEAPGGRPVLKAYYDSKRVPTIGFGHIKGVKIGDTCTEAQAWKWLDEDLDEAELAVTQLVKVPLNRFQFAALVSWVFNVGRGAFYESTLLRLLNHGRYDLVDEQMMRWDKIKHDDGRVETLRGLRNRRIREAAWWNREPGAQSLPIGFDPNRLVRPKFPRLDFAAGVVAPTPEPPEVRDLVFDNTVPDAPPADRGVLGTSTGKAQVATVAAGGAAKAAGEMASHLNATASDVSQLALYLDVAQYLFIALMIGAVGFTVYERWTKLKEGR